MALRVLLADESTTIKKVMQLALQDFAVEVKSVQSGLDVVEVARSFQPDIIFTDVLLQKQNGYEVCATLKRDPILQAIPLVLMWSSFMDLDERVAQSCGCDRRLEKPFDVENLRQIVLELVPKTRTQRLAHFLKFPDNLTDAMKHEDATRGVNFTSNLSHPGFTQTGFPLPEVTQPKLTNDPVSWPVSPVTPPAAAATPQPPPPPRPAAQNFTNPSTINPVTKPATIVPEMSQVDKSAIFGDIADVANLATDDPDTLAAEPSLADLPGLSLQDDAVVPKGPTAPEAPSSWNMESFEEIAEFSMEDEPSVGPQLVPDADDDGGFKEIRFAKKADASRERSASFAEDVTEVKKPLSHEDRDPWSHQDLSRFRLDLEDISPDENHLDLENLPDPVDFRLQRQINKPVRAPVDKMPDTMAELPNVIELEDDGDHEPIHLEQPSAPARSHSEEKIDPQRLEQIIRAQSREVIEALVRKIVPDLASHLIREELRRLLDESR